MANKSKSEEKIERKLDWQCQSIDKCIKVIMGLLGCDRDAAFEYARTRTRSNTSIKTTLKKNNPLNPPTGGSERVSSEKVEFTPPKFTPPTMNEVNDYFKQQGFESDAETFYNYYEMRGWAGIKDWHPAAKNWEKHYWEMQDNKSSAKKYKQEKIGALFSRFWDSYPKHEGKQIAFKKFAKIMKGCKSQEEMEALLKKMLKAIDESKYSRQWNKEDGRYIPKPQSWLEGRRWEDEGVVAIRTESQKRADELASRLAKALTF